MIEEEKTIIPEEIVEGSANATIERGTNIGRYVILKPIGKGGMGEVFAAYDASLERKVAIKILRADAPGKATAARQKRLLREAQAMARLTHPNVNIVHDVGLFQNRIFIAMEYIDGWTIRQWLQEKQPNHKEIIAVFMQAGLGLAAAHEAGLVHRDIKPDNILIGKDGRVKVTDFGLVSESSENDPLEQSTVDMEVADTYPERATQPLTKTGALLGSPPYMAPEQHQSLPTDAKSDQFSFCIALYEALYGQRPFEGHSSSDLARAVASGHIQPIPTNTKVPNRLRAILLRGLNVRPELRYPSMKTLLADLGKNPTKTRIRVLTWIGVVLAVLALEWGLLQRVDRRGICKGAERHLAGVWDAKVREKANQTFLATGLPKVGQSWDQVARAIDQYTRDWVAHHQSACEATHVHGEQSTDLLDLRMHCLNRRLREIAELTKLLGAADRQTAEKAVQAAYKLTPLAGCADTDSLNTTAALPLDPELQNAVRQTEDLLAKAKALADAGKYKEALETAQKALQAAETTSHQPTLAEAYHLLSKTYLDNGYIQKAEKMCMHAIWAATAGKHDTVAAQAWNHMVYIVGHQKAQYEQGHWWADFAQAAVNRLENPALKAELLNYRGLILQEEKNYPQAYDNYQKSLRLRLKTFGPDHPEVASSYNSLGIVINRLGRYEESSMYYQKALSIIQKAYGKNHHITITILNNLGYALHRYGRNQEAIDRLQEALSISKDLLQSEHHLYSKIYENLGIAHLGLYQYEDAIKFHQLALDGKYKLFGKQYHGATQNLLNLGETYCEIGNLNKAMMYLTKSQSNIKKYLKNDINYLGFLHRSLCKIFYKQKKLTRALSECKKSLQYHEELTGLHHPELSYTLHQLGLVEADLGDPKAALDHIFRALELREKSGLHEFEIAPLKFALAKILWQFDMDRKQAVSYAQAAEQIYRRAPDSFAAQKKSVRRWLKQRVE